MDLERWLRGEPIEARPVRPWVRLAKWVKRKPAIAALSTAVVLVAIFGLESHWSTVADGLVNQLLKAKTAEVPGIINAMNGYRWWVNPALHKVLEALGKKPSEYLHASLALLPDDPKQADYLYEKLFNATADEVDIIATILKPKHVATRVPMLWDITKQAQPLDAKLLRAAGALAVLDPENHLWKSIGDKVAEALVKVDAVELSPWLELLGPVSDNLKAPVAKIFKEKSRPEIEHRLASGILSKYAEDDPALLADILMEADPKSYESLFPLAAKQKSRVIPIFRDELTKKKTYQWVDTPIDPALAKPDKGIETKIQSAYGLLTEHFGFCQTMPPEDFVETAEILRKSGYRPTRFRPYADGPDVRVAAVWTRDGRDWRMVSGLTTEQAREHDKAIQSANFVPVDVTGYVDAKADRYAALWVQKAGNDDARLYVGATDEEFGKETNRLKNKKLVPRTHQAMLGSDGRTRDSGVWGLVSGDLFTNQERRDQFEGNFKQDLTRLSDQTLIDISLNEASRSQPVAKRAQKSIKDADEALKKKLEDVEPLLTRARDNIRRGENQKALDDLNAVVGKVKETTEADFGKINADPDLDPIRDDPMFTELMNAGHPDRRYAAVWTSDPSFEAKSLYGLNPESHLSKCRELMVQDYRPVSISVTGTMSEGMPLAASVWQRPVVEEEVKDELAERQARAAIALVRMGKDDEVWKRLIHSTDPRLRSFIVNWLSPLGADPRTLVAQFNHLPSATKPTPAQGQQFMDAVLFQPDISMRRALIIALGDYGKEKLSPGEGDDLIGKLLDLYRNDPDAGIHGACEWTLRQWKEDENIKLAVDELSKLKDIGDRRWFVNSLGQTFTIIDGPVEFLMGAPATEMGRSVGGNDQSPHRKSIPRRYAIATKEVSKAQWQAFVKEYPKLDVASPTINRYSPDGDGPMIGFDWYISAAFCNWLSQQENLPKDQWCYLPVTDGKNEKYAAGMTIPADVLKRRGYRLPTEAEWEYACRSGTMTSYYYGHSLSLLDQYVRYQRNTKDHAWSCGSLRPNDLGLFDMLGNVFEWVQDEYLNEVETRTDNINKQTYVQENRRILRGGSFLSLPLFVRSAAPSRYVPSFRNNFIGFRPARTLEAK